MKQIFFLLLISLIALNAFSQQTISIKEESVELKDQMFFVHTVKDTRVDKSNIGEIRKGDKITVEGGFLKAAENYFFNNFSKSEEDQQGTEIQIKYLYVKQKPGRESEHAYMKMIIDFVDKNGYRFEAVSEIEENVEDAFNTHEERIRRGFYECVVKYNNSLEKNTVVTTDDEQAENAMEIVFDNNVSEDIDKDDYDIHKEMKKEPRIKNRNITTVGYQIGGLNLLGIDHEIRVHDYVGVHFGVGLLGYTGGVKIHTNEKTNSLFINLSWKDMGLGMMNGVGLEAGARWIWSQRTGFGLLYQGGFFVVNHLDDDLKTTLYGTAEAPSVMFSMGLGLSW